MQERQAVKKKGVYLWQEHGILIGHFLYGFGFGSGIQAWLKFICMGFDLISIEVHRKTAVAHSGS